MFIAKGIAGADALAKFSLASIFFGTVFLGNADSKGVRWLEGYFTGYYTIWLSIVKRFLVPFWEFACPPAAVLPKPVVNWPAGNVSSLRFFRSLLIDPAFQLGCADKNVSVSGAVRRIEKENS